MGGWATGAFGGGQPLPEDKTMRKSWIIRKDEKAVSPVIATILMVAITVVLASVLYVMVTGLLTGPGASKPQVTVASPPGITNGFQFAVAAASQSKALANYKLNFLVDTTPGTAVALGAAQTFTAGGNTYTVTYSDVRGEGSLTGGDRVTAAKSSPPGPPASPATYARPH